MILLLASVISARAGMIGIDLGPSHTVTSQTPPSPFADLNGTQLNGQSVSMDLSFLNSEFVRIFSVTSNSFQASIKLQTSISDFHGFLDGTGYLIDINGNAIPGFGITGSASGSDGTLGISLFPLFKDADGTPNTDLLKPFDFYGIHYDLMFPDVANSAVIVTGGQFSLLSDPDGVFGIGPGIPRNIVPETGDTLFLFGLGVLVSIGLRTYLG